MNAETECLEVYLHPDRMDELVESLAEHDPVTAAEFILGLGAKARKEHLQLATQLIGELPSEETEYVLVSLNKSDLRPGRGLRYEDQREHLADRLAEEWQRRGSEEWLALARQIGTRPKESSSTRRKWLWDELMQLNYQRQASTRTAELLIKRIKENS